MSLGKRFLRGAGMSLMEHGVKTAAVFLTTPLMNRALGADHYGYWLVVMAALGWFTMLDLGMSFTTTRFLSLAVGARDETRQATVMDVATKHFQRISLITAIGSTLVFLLLPLWFAPPNERSTTTLLIATLPAAISLSLRFWYRLPQLRLRAWVRYDLLALAAILRTIVQSGVLLWLLPRQPLLLVVGFAQAGGDMLELLLQVFFARSLPRVQADAETDSTLRKEMIKFMRDMVLGTLGDGVRSNVGPFTAAHTAGVASVPVLSVGTRLVTLLEDVVNALFGGGVLAVFGQLHGADDKARLRAEFARITRITAGFGAWVIAGLMLYSGPFIARWMGKGFEASPVIVLIIALPYALRFMQYPSHSLLFALGHQEQMMWLRCLGGVAAGVLAISLGLVWGIRGVAAGCAIEMAVSYAVIMPMLVGRCLEISGWKYLVLDVIAPGLRGALLPVLAAWGLRSWAQPDYRMLFTCFAVYAAVFAATAPFTLLDAEGRRVLRRALGR